eukprot:743193_1
MHSFSKKCTKCDNNVTYDHEDCTDNVRICNVCDHSIEGINSNRNYEKRVKYYQDAVAMCIEVNPLILASICRIIAQFCSDKPRFIVNDVVDYYFDVKKQWFASEVLDVRYQFYEQIQIVNPNQSLLIEQKIWVNAYDGNVARLNIVRPVDTKDTITVLCGQCDCVLFEELKPFEYVIKDPTQAHFSYELYTDIEPLDVNVVRLERNTSMLNCKNNCHEPLWLIDNGTGYIDLHGYRFALACGRKYTVCKVKEDDSI